MPGKILSYMHGYLRICISGLSVERFINSCSYRGIHLWDVSPVGTQYHMNISIKDFKKIKPVIRKTRTNVRIVERTGFPFFLKKFQTRKIFIFGIFLCYFLIFFFTTLIVNIQIKGNNFYTSESILEFLNSMNVTKGMKIRDIDCYEISNNIRKNFNDIIWVSTSINGSNLVINIKENNDSKTIRNNNSSVMPYDIIAEDKFRITRTIIRNGIILVKPGDYVNKGDVLVEGKIPVYNDAREIIDYQYCFSDADIYGEKNIIYEDEIGLSTYEKEYETVQKREYSLIINKFRLRLGNINNDYDNFDEHSKQYDLGIFKYETRTVKPYKRKKKVYPVNEIQEILTLNFNYYCLELEKKGVVILKNNVKIYTWSDKAKATGTLTIEMPIGYKVKSQLFETGDYIDGNDGDNN